MRAITFLATDAFELGGTLYGESQGAKAGVLIAPAMGVSQRFYGEFARWLAAQGMVVLVFDYRGMGASRPKRFERSLRGLEADVRLWAERDAAAALSHLQGLLDEGRPVYWVGHSLGGQIIGMVPGHERISRVITIGTGSGYWRENAPALRRYVWWLWYVVVPLTLPLFGYFPGRRLHKVGDLPAGVMAQWRRWCLHRDYMMGEGGAALREQYAQVEAPILSLSFTDDEFMSARNSEAFHAFYTGAPRRMERIAPEHVGARRIGHFGFFRSGFKDTLWPKVTGWLSEGADAGGGQSMGTEVPKRSSGS